MKHHPEQLKGEIYLGNFFYKNLSRIGWNSKRVGSISYDIEGNIIPSFDGLSPVFIKITEVEEKIKDCKYAHAIESYKAKL